MGEITEMILEGILCELCGVYIDDNFKGIPRKCKNCRRQTQGERRKKTKKENKSGHNL